MNEPAYLSTLQVAARLGVAVSTVQAWVKSGALPAWKTAGGHRRIPLNAVENMQLGQLSAGLPEPHVYQVLVVEDEPVQWELYRRHFSDWRLPMQLRLAVDGLECLLLSGRRLPDLIITDLSMPKMDGFRMLHLLDRQAQGQCQIIVVTALSAQEITAGGGIPDGVPVYPKPIPFPALRCLIERRIEQRTASEAHNHV